jgi:uncharacterized protein
MKRTKAGIVAGLTSMAMGVFAAFPGSALAQEEPIDYTNTVTVSAGSKVEQDADLATIAFGIRAQDDQAAAATREVAETTEAVVASLRAAGVAQDELTVGGVRLARRTDRRGRLLRYVASVSVKVETDRMNRLGAYIDAAVAGGADSIRDLEYDVKDRTGAVTRALREAIEFARAKAEALAEAENREVGAAIVISEYDSRPPRSVSFDSARGSLATSGGRAEPAALIPLEPPTITTQARITATFELV